MNGNPANPIRVFFERMCDLYGVTGKNGIQFKFPPKRLNVSFQASDSQIASAFEARDGSLCGFELMGKVGLSNRQGFAQLG